MWVKEITQLNEAPPANFAGWMTRPKNLGKVLREICGKVELQLIEQTFGEPFVDEITYLKLSDASIHDCLRRRIFLLADGVPVTFASVIIPPHVYAHHREAFDSLGNKLIGETLLYNNPQTTRSAFEFAKITDHHPFFHMIHEVLPDAAQHYWGRRSIFNLTKNESISISEFFLPQIPLYPSSI